MPFGQSLSNLGFGGNNQVGNSDIGIGGFGRIGAGLGGAIGGLITDPGFVNRLIDITIGDNRETNVGFPIPGVPSLPGGSTGTVPSGPVGSGGPARGGAAAPFGHRAQGLWHVTPCGNTAANQVVFENGPKGELYAGMVKRISMAKLKKSLMSQIRSSPRRAHSHRALHRHPRRR